MCSSFPPWIALLPTVCHADGAGVTHRGPITSVLFALFGLAVVCALGAIVAFTVEMLMAGTGIRAEVRQRLIALHVVGGIPFSGRL
jgi:hypothetical protein